MSDVKRYTAAGSGVVKTDPNGELVSYADYARLKDEIEYLKQVGDDMAHMAAHRGVNKEAHADFMFMIKAWLAAKEGKQP